MSYRASRIMGRSNSSYVITDEHRYQVTVMAANGMSAVSIAKVLDIRESTVERRFKDEIATGREKIRAQMGAVLVAKALEGNISALKFWLANHCPEWRMVREDPLQELPERGGEDVVHFYLPPNGRDEPEELPGPPVIEGEVEEAA
jgi:hypothetical protein